MTGATFEAVEQNAQRVHEAFVARGSFWVGALSSERVTRRDLRPPRGQLEVARAPVFALRGADVSRLGGLRVQVSGVALEEVLLPDGRRLMDAVEVSESTAPAKVLRLDQRRVIEFSVGTSLTRAQKVLEGLGASTSVELEAWPPDRSSRPAR